MTISGSPVGHIDSISTAPDDTGPWTDTTIKGWAFDPDLNGGPVTIDVYPDNSIGLPSSIRLIVLREKYDHSDLRIYAVNTAGFGSSTLLYKGSGYTFP